MSDIMVDIETYDNIPTAAIASIGAVKFDLVTRQIIDKFYVTIDPASSKEHGLSFGRETLDWWKQQNPAALKALRVNNIPLPDALDQFAKFFGDSYHCCCWGMFDVPILQYAYSRLGQSAPFQYFNTIDCRTMAIISGAKINRKSEGTHHNALDDAMVQTKYWINLLNPEEIK